MSLTKDYERYFLFIEDCWSKGNRYISGIFISSHLNKDFKLKIIGPIEDASLWANLKKLIDQHESIEYLGFRSGKEKIN